MRNIAHVLNRSVSTVSDEIRRNIVRGVYDPKKAAHKAYVRRRESKYQGMHIVEHQETRNFVDAALLDDLSPEAIAGRLRTQEKHIVGISKDSIYRYIKSVYGRRIEYYRSKKRKRKIHRIHIRPSLEDRIFIDQRPQYINSRRRIGDMEGDFIVSGKNGSGVLLVVVDRKIRMTFLELLTVVTLQNVHNAFARIQERYPEMKSITLDNDILFQKHKELQELLSVPIYFCHPYHSWEKGTVENVNKYIRRDVPKGTNLAKLTTSFIVSLEAKLNRRPMQCLKYQTPYEVLQTYRTKKKH